MTKYELFIQHREQILSYIEIGASSGQICNMLNNMYSELELLFKSELKTIEDIHNDLIENSYNGRDY